MVDLSGVTAGDLSVEQVRQAVAEGNVSRKEAARLLVNNVRQSLARLSGTQCVGSGASQALSSTAAIFLRAFAINVSGLRVLEVDAPDCLSVCGQYDVVVIAGLHETFAAQTEVADPLGHILRRAYSALVPGGRIVVAGLNALALRHFNDQRDAYGREGALAIEGRFPDGAPALWSTSTMSRALSSAGFQSLTPCALMGSVEQPRLLVSPQGCELSAERWNLETLVRRALVGSDPGRLARFSESHVLREVVQSGALANWSDGYVFLAHKSADRQVSLGGWLASVFSSEDSGDGGQETRFTVEAERDEIRVETYLEGNAEPDSVGTYVNGAVYRDRLDDVLQTPGWTFEQVLQWSAVWLRCLLASLDGNDALAPKGAYGEAYSRNYDLWVPERLFLATPTRWVQRPEGSFQCIQDMIGSEGTAPLAMVLYAGLMSTFETLRSVAEPADAEWLNPAALANAVVRRLGYAPAEEDWGALAAHWQRVTGAVLPSPKHFVAREKPRALTDEAKLYWATESGGFSESNASTATLAFDGSPQVLRLSIGTPDQAVTALRFDVANRPGCFEIESITVLQASGEVLWQWDHTREALSGVQGATLVVDQAAGRSCVLSRGNDPQFVLNVPEPALAAGGVLAVWLSAWPQRL